MPADIKASVEEKIVALKKERESGILEAIKSATEALSGELSKIGQAMSQNNSQPTTNDQQQNPGEQTPPSEPNASQ